MGADIGDCTGYCCALGKVIELSIHNPQNEKPLDINISNIHPSEENSVCCHNLLTYLWLCEQKKCLLFYVYILSLINIL